MPTSICHFFPHDKRWCRCICEHSLYMCFVRADLGVELLGYRACTFSILIATNKLFSWVTIPIYIPTGRLSVLGLEISFIAVFLWNGSEEPILAVHHLVTTDASVDLYFPLGYQSRLQYLCGNRGQKGESVFFIFLVSKKKPRTLWFKPKCLRLDDGLQQWFVYWY